MSKAEMYYEFLKEEGYVPQYDGDGDIIFKKEGLTYIAFASEDDDEFFRLALPAFWAIRSREENVRALIAAAEVNAEVKVVKVFPVGDRVWATIELLVDPPEGFATVFPRAMRLLRRGAERFVETMRESD